MSYPGYKMDKYYSKLQNCNDIMKKEYYQSKLNFYSSQTGGVGETNVLIVFNSSDISGSPLEKLMSEKDGQDINENLMAKSDLEKLLKNKAYIIEEKKKEAELVGSGALSGLLSKSDDVATIDGSKLTGDYSKNIKSEMKNLESSLAKILKNAENMKSEFSKKTEEITKINESYNTRKTNFESSKAPTAILDCTDKIIKTVGEIVELLNIRNTKIGELDTMINESTQTINEKLKSLGTSLQEIDSINDNILKNAKTYNDGTKEYVSCVTPSKKITVQNTYTIINYQDVAKKIKEQSETKMVLDSYMICTLKKIGKNNLLKIGKF
jgi:hypothetical protein